MASVFVKTAVAMLAILVVHQSLNWGATAQTCVDVYGDIRPCVTVFNNTTGIAATACCNGMLAVYTTALPVLGNQGTCRCIQNWFASALPSPQISFASRIFTSVMNQCNVTFGFNITNPGSC